MTSDRRDPSYPHREPPAPPEPDVAAELEAQIAELDAVAWNLPRPRRRVASPGPAPDGTGEREVRRSIS